MKKSKLSGLLQGIARRIISSEKRPGANLADCLYSVDLCSVRFAMISSYLDILKGKFIRFGDESVPS